MKNLHAISIQVSPVLNPKKRLNEKQKLNCHLKRDHYIHHINRFGIICYKKLGDPLHHFAFAWQIIETRKVFRRFDGIERHFIESLAIREHQDGWYCDAGRRLQYVGFEKFIADAERAS